MGDLAIDQLNAEMETDDVQCSRTEIAGPTSYRQAVRNARYGHRDWIAWGDDQGTSRADYKNAASIRRAMLATGTRYHFFLISANTGTAIMVTWPIAVIMLKNCKYGI